MASAVGTLVPLALIICTFYQLYNLQEIGSFPLVTPQLSGCIVLALPDARAIFYIINCYEMARAL